MDLPDANSLLRDAATMVRVHFVVPRCPTVPGEHLLLVGDCEGMGHWDVRKGLRLDWCAGHMHTATLVVPAAGQSLKAKLVLVHGETGAAEGRTSWEMGHDRNIVLQAPLPKSTVGASGTDAALATDGRSGSSSEGARSGTVTRGPLRTTFAHDYVVVLHWGHTEATSVLAREVPGDVLVGAGGGAGGGEDGEWCCGD